jgi:hypothetical protein
VSDDERWIHRMDRIEGGMDRIKQDKIKLA